MLPTQYARLSRSFLSPAGQASVDQLAESSTAEVPSHARAANDTRVAGPAHAAPAPMTHRALYDALMRGNASAACSEPARVAARSLIDDLLVETQDAPCDLPREPEDLAAWMTEGIEATGIRYQAYLARRKAGGEREFFRSRSHALSFLRQVAPTKLVDGAWLYGLLAQWRNPRFADLVHTYVEELGDGSSEKNHVFLYRRLLQSHGIDDWAAQDDAHFEQGALQLALATCTADFLPEVIGFNLGYEQLPLHLLITAYELNELGIDPYYFTLHVTVDNAASGHAQRAVKAVLSALPQLEGREEFWRRVRNGYRLNDTGLGTNAAIAAFDLHEEMLDVLARKSAEGRAAHSDYCRIEGKTVNEWLASKEHVSDFVAALERKGWLRRGQDPAQSRFWQLLHGERAEMFGVFSEYELQVIYDWIRGDACSDGARVPALGDASAPTPPRSFRHQRRAARFDLDLTAAGHLEDPSLDPDIAALERHMAADADPEATLRLLVQLMGPAHHWQMAGLQATRIFADQLLHARSF
jgi:hypothetical protein